MNRKLTTIALFTVFDDLVTAERTLVLLEAVDLALLAENRVQYGRNVSHGARGEFVVVQTFT